MRLSALSRKQDPRTTATELVSFAQDVRRGLTATSQKALPPKYFYDDLGSALFEAITHLPEYGLTRAEDRILCANARHIARLLDTPVVVAELGSGGGRKTGSMLRAITAEQQGVRYYPIDVSKGALGKCRSELASVAQVHPIEAGFLEGLEQAVAQKRAGEQMTVLFLGSTIGNFDRDKGDEFLSAIAGRLSPGDVMLIGADLVKPVEVMLRAYDDPTLVTASFNLNLLGRMNRELGADFDLRRFVHVARYDERARRVEMHLRSVEDQTVAIPDAGCIIEFRGGETIWTESSHKYLESELAVMAERNGFRLVKTWTDREWPFADSLWVVA